MTTTPHQATGTDYDAVVIGAGFAGLYAVHALREKGLRVHGFDEADDVGGTWYWNRYPGVHCDTYSQSYCYSFSDEVRRGWTWSERFPSGAEILRYLNHAADTLDLRRSYTFGTRVEGVTWDEAERLWTLTINGSVPVRARFCVLAVGSLSEPVVPDIAGLPDFAGRVVHTSRWPEDLDVTGQNVGIVGTGSSGVQAVPHLAERAARLTVFQRTANYVVPARHAALGEDEVADWAENFLEYRARARYSAGGSANPPPTETILGTSPERRAERFEQLWQRGGAFEFLSTFTDLRSDLAANEIACEFVRGKIRSIVHDPRTAELLCPDIWLGLKRLQVADNYYESFNRSNVELVDIKANPLSFTPTGARVAGTDHPLDVLVLATGFDALTGQYTRMDIKGVDGVSVREHWADGPQTYLGLTIHGFPNLFALAGPGSPSVLGNVVVAVEQHVEWMVELIDHATGAGVDRIEATESAETEWTAHVNEVGAARMISGGDSWYLGSNVPGKPRVFLPYAGGYGEYRRICERVAAEGYTGLTLDSTAVGASTG